MTRVIPEESKADLGEEAAALAVLSSSGATSSRIREASHDPAVEAHASRPRADHSRGRNFRQQRGVTPPVERTAPAIADSDGVGRRIAGRPDRRGRPPASVSDTMGDPPLLGRGRRDRRVQPPASVSDTIAVRRAASDSPLSPPAGGTPSAERRAGVPVHRVAPPGPPAGGDSAGAVRDDRPRLRPRTGRTARRRPHPPAPKLDDAKARRETEKRKVFLRCLTGRTRR